MKFDFKKLVPHLIAIGIFLIISVIYCKPVLEGMQVAQHDLIQWRGMAEDAFKYKERHGVFPLWNNGLFSGMPNYNIAFQSNAYIPAVIINVMSLGLPEPISYFFLSCICFYFLAQVLRINPWISILGAIGFAFCSYNPIIIATGHHTKMVTMALMPALLGALLLLYHRKYLLGGALTAAFTAAIVVNNHLQIIYYMLFIIAGVTIAYIIKWVKNGETAHMLKSGGIAIAAAILGALTCSVNLFTTYDYSAESMRGGKASLIADSTGTANQSRGLDADYAFRWSYGKAETLSLLVPNVNGGASQALGEDSRFYESLITAYQSKQIDDQTAQQLAQFGSAYWGDQPFTSGPVYAGAVIVLLFLLGLIVPNFHRWWILAVVGVCILMAWGHNFSGFNNFLFNYLPFYNKFRAPSMILVVPQLLMPLLAVIGLHKLIYSEAPAAEKWKWVKQTGIAAGALLLIAIFYYFMSDFRSQREQDTLASLMQSGGQLLESIRSIFNAAAEDRQKLFMNDWLRSLAFIVLGFAALYLFVKNKMKPQIAVIALLALSSIDLISVSRRYLNDTHFEPADDTTPAGSMALQNRPLYNALTEIQKDTDPQYRVFNMTGDVFNDALTSNFVRSVGGYHPAKLSIYQDLIEHQLGSQTPNMGVFNMLNTRYFVVPGQQGPQVQRNPYAYGPAWLAKNVVVVNDPAEEMRMLGQVQNLMDTAIVQQQYSQQLGSTNFTPDSTASIRLNQYDNDLITYIVNTTTPAFAVLSEIFYSRGWNAYADGKQVPVVKTNYVLRGVPLPAGTKNLELKFEPKSYSTGKTITEITQWLVVLLVLFGLGWEMYRNAKTKENEPEVVAERI